jgi:hypothetical protein
MSALLKKRWLGGVVIVGGLIWITGCGSGSKPDANATTPPPPAAAKLLLSTEPVGAKNIVEIREQAKDKDEVVLVGRIGGDRDPWVEGMAAFKITDLSCVPCNERPGDDCKFPWDYCCEDNEKMKKSVAMVQIVDDHGKVIAEDAKKSLGFKELQTIVIQGIAERDKDNNLTVNAKKVFIRK